MYRVIHVSARNLCQILKFVEISRQIWEKYFQKIHENPSILQQSFIMATQRLTAGQTDTKLLMVCFRNCTKAP